ncbi:MAG: ABC transporter permease subunit [Oscillospiraceae bacterium]|nr:ABC transporter permease subunit [Oscillospiraceae bacterium]
MTLIRHELRQGRTGFWIWTASIASLILVCILLFPEMKTQMDSVSEMFATMGAFSAAFGMDRLGFGTLLGFYSVECGNILGLGGAFFAAFLASASLAKEEKDHTAEFLLTHPVSRVTVITEKLAALVLQLVAMNVLVFLLSVAGVAFIGEEIPWKELSLLHLAYFLMQLEVAGICFAISAFLRGGSAGIGLGLATLLYFLNIIANLSEKLDWMKYLTPFGYTEAADIVTDGALDGPMVAVGMAVTVLAVAVAYWWYSRKDIR